MKKLMNLDGIKTLNKKEQQNILGGSDKCQQLFISANCCHPWWTTVCGFPGGGCSNGVCYL
ncbi:hypothetical protein [Flagellimonas pacifica]|uniref:Bacteriocin n=1 Tax=Flagellimonas pacifica TaxID=1247520 RepID=A0A285MWC5_9FLAO|nr:hypothetical protein [Allomuricauda parva]SNZ00116.1 hypothetical protein SAMN06265377_1933 [Allomuricauda parva]